MPSKASKAKKASAHVNDQPQLGLVAEPEPADVDDLEHDLGGLPSPSRRRTVPIQASELQGPTEPPPPAPWKQRDQNPGRVPPAEPPPPAPWKQNDQNAGRVPPSEPPPPAPWKQDAPQGCGVALNADGDSGECSFIVHGLRDLQIYTRQDMLSGWKAAVSGPATSASEVFEKYPCMLSETKDAVAARKKRAGEVLGKETATEGQPLSSEAETEMDKLLEKTFFAAVRDGVGTPIKGTTLYTDRMRPLRPPGTSLQVKESSFKTFRKFLEHLQDKGYLTLSDASDPVVTSINEVACMMTQPKSTAAGGSSSMVLTQTGTSLRPPWMQSAPATASKRISLTQSNVDLKPKYSLSSLKNTLTPAWMQRRAAPSTSELPTPTTLAAESDDRFELQEDVADSL